MVFIQAGCGLKFTGFLIVGVFCEAPAFIARGKGAVLAVIAFRDNVTLFIKLSYKAGIAGNSVHFFAAGIVISDLLQLIAGIGPYHGGVAEGLDIGDIAVRVQIAQASGLTGGRIGLLPGGVAEGGVYGAVMIIHILLEDLVALAVAAFFSVVAFRQLIGVAFGVVIADECGVAGL